MTVHRKTLAGPPIWIVRAQNVNATDNLSQRAPTMGNMNTKQEVESMTTRATYTGPTMGGGFGTKPTLIHGQRVLVVGEGAATLTGWAGDITLTVTYDPADPKHNQCEWSMITLIKGVPAHHLVKEIA